VTSSRDHDLVREMLPAAALEALDQGDLDRVLSHVRSCDRCAAELADYHQVVASLSLLLPPRLMDPARSRLRRARLLLRARADSRRGRRRPALLAAAWSGWTVAAGLAGLLMLHHAIHRPVDYGWLFAGGLAIALVGVGVYALVLRGRLRAHRERLAAAKRDKPSPE